MWTGPLGHRDVGAQARAQLDVFFEAANCRKIVVVDDRQLLPGAALRGNVAGGIPDRQSAQNLTVVFADHAPYLPAFRTALAQRATLKQSTRRGLRCRNRRPVLAMLTDAVACLLCARRPAHFFIGA